MNNANHTPTPNSINFSAAALWASAFVILALVIVQAGRLPGNLANAATVADRGAYTLMTADSGKGGDTEPDEILLVIDSREQMLLVYETEDTRRAGSLVLRDGYSLDGLFVQARR